MPILPLLLGGLLGLGLTLVVAGAVPVRPDLRAVIASARSTTAHHQETTLKTHLGVALERLAAAPWLPINAPRLALARMAPAQYVTFKLGGVVAGTLVPGLLWTVLAVLGTPVPGVLPAGLALAGGCIGFLVPDAIVRERAERARAQVREATAAYLTLVALALKSGNGLDSALVKAATIADTWVWQTIRRALDHAVLARQPAWEGLRALSRELDAPELADVADIVTTGSDGTAVAATMMARSRALRHQILAEQRTEANETSERLVIPTALLGLTFMAMLFYPVVSRLLTTV